MKKTLYTNAPADIGKAIEGSDIIDDFLPSPDKLVFKEENVKVTLELSKRSVRLFKKYAHGYTPITSSVEMRVLSLN
jgi:hypothetical protein